MIYIASIQQSPIHTASTCGEIQSLTCVLSYGFQVMTE